MLRVKHHLELDVTWCRHLEGIVLYLMSSRSHIMHIQLQRVDDHPFQHGQAGMLGVPSAWKWKLHCAAPFVSQCRTGPCVKWLGAWQKVHLFFQDQKSGPNPTAAPLQETIGDLIFADFKQNHLQYLFQFPWCRIQVASLTPSYQKTRHTQNQNPFLNYTSTLNQTHPLTYVVLSETRLDMAGARCKPCVSTKTQTSGSLCRACTAKNLNSLPAFYQVNVSSMLNSTPKKRAPSHLDPLTTHEPFLFIFYLFLFCLIMLIGVYQTKQALLRGQQVNKESSHICQATDQADYWPRIAHY